MNKKILLTLLFILCPLFISLLNNLLLKASNIFHSNMSKVLNMIIGGNNE